MSGRVLPFRARAGPDTAPGQAPQNAALGAAERERFRRTVLPHLDAAYSFARFLCRDAAAAEDIVQEAFLRACRGFAGFRGETPRAWLFAIVRNCVFTQGRAERARAELFAAVPDTSEEPPAEAAPDTPESLLVRSREVEVVRRAIGALPEPFRETLVLRELEDLSYREVAEVTGAPIGTVMSRLARARKMLADALGPEEEVRP
jgi:RNA polymerase sigma-70 factor (ECF subfamily)